MQGVHLCETIVNFQNRPVPPNLCCHVLALSGGLVVGWHWGSGTGYRAPWADSFYKIVRFVPTCCRVAVRRRTACSREGRQQARARLRRACRSARGGHQRVPQTVVGAACHRLVSEIRLVVNRDVRGAQCERTTHCTAAPTVTHSRVSTRRGAGGHTSPVRTPAIGSKLHHTRLPGGLQ